MAVGAAIVAGAVLCVVLIDWRPRPEPEPVLVRPLKTTVVGAALAPASRRYPGRVHANEEVNLAFQVAGPLVEFPIKKGARVGKGALLARIDPRDFENNLAANRAAAVKRKLDVERNTRAF